MNNVVSFSNREYGDINGVIVPKPRNRMEYLSLCKRFLIVEDYVDVCIAILDTEWYDKVEQPIKNVVNCYYDL